MKKIPAINGLRGIAILTVMAYHIWYPLVGGNTRQSLLSIGGTTILHHGFFQNGQMAVYLFFILSGFVLALPYASGMRTMASVRDAVWFYKNRALRLLPLYYVNLAVLMTLHGSLPREPIPMLRDIFLMGTATFHFVPSMWFPKYNGVLWSIGSELWFCVLMPLILLAIRRYGTLRTFAIIFPVSLVLQSIGATTIGAGINHISNNVLGDMWFFGLGIAAAYVHVRHRGHAYVRIIGGSLLIGCALLMYDKLMVGAWHLKKEAYPVITTLFGVGWALFILGLTQTKNSVLNILFSNRPLQLIGMMSYSLYVWHPSVLPYFTVLMTPFNFLRMLFMLSLLGWLSYRYIEFGRVSDVRALLPRKPELTDGMSPVPAS